MPMMSAQFSDWFLLEDHAVIYLLCTAPIIIIKVKNLTYTAPLAQLLPQM